MKFPPRGISKCLTRREELVWKWYPVPGCKLDPLNKKHKFNKWQKLPQKAHRLYWRLHPEAYEKMCGKNP